jgi:hypothetical protein
LKPNFVDEGNEVKAIYRQYPKGIKGAKERKGENPERE